MSHVDYSQYFIHLTCLKGYGRLGQTTPNISPKKLIH